MKNITCDFVNVKSLFQSCKSALAEKRLRKKYPDYKGRTLYDCGDYKFMWGAKSRFDMSSAPACLPTMNYAELVYSRVTKKYILRIETAIWFDSKEQEVEYLLFLLDAFTKYMKENNLSTDDPYRFWMSEPSPLFRGDTIAEVYTGFKLFVEGYISIHKQADAERDADGSN